MSGAAKPTKGAAKGPDLNVVDSPPAHHAPVTVAADEAPSKPAKPAQENAASVPKNTTADPWADLHPARIWPD